MKNVLTSIKIFVLLFILKIYCYSNIATSLQVDKIQQELALALQQLSKVTQSDETLRSMHLHPSAPL